MKLYAGPQRTFDDFQNRVKKYSSVRKKNPNEEDMIYITETGYTTPPEINFFFNPALSIERNRQEFERNKFKVNLDSMFLECSAYERWMFEAASRTDQSHRVSPTILLETEPSARYDISFLNTLIGPMDEYIDIEFTVRDYWDQELYKNQNLKELLELSNLVYFKKLPDLITSLEENSHEIIDIYKFKRFFKKFGIPLRHVGIVANNIKIPHITELCIDFMVAVSICKILSFGMIERYFDALGLQARLSTDKNASDPQSPLVIQQQKKKEPIGGKKTQKDMKDRRTSYKSDEMQRNYVLEFLRFLFLRTESSTKIWNEMYGQITQDRPTNRSRLQLLPARQVLRALERVIDILQHRAALLLQLRS